MCTLALPPPCDPTTSCMMWGGRYHHCKLLIPQQCRQSHAAWRGLCFLSVWLMRHTDASLCAAGLYLGFFFLDAGLLCVHQSGTEPYINWQIGSRQPRDSLWCTHCCGHAVTCASPCQWCTLKVSWVWCGTNSLSTNTSLTDSLFSLNAHS